MTRSRNPAGHAGLLENLLALSSALTEFFESRFALFAQESKAALVQLLVLAGLFDFSPAPPLQPTPLLLANFGNHEREKEMA